MNSPGHLDSHTQHIISTVEPMFIGLELTSGFFFSCVQGRAEESWGQLGELGRAEEIGRAKESLGNLGVATESWRKLGRARESWGELGKAGESYGEPKRAREW